MIEDIEGATTEPPRRSHLVAVSAALAAASLALLVALHVPQSTVRELPLAASPTASPSTGLIYTSDPLSRMRVDLSRRVICHDGTPLTPPYFIAANDRGGQLFVVAQYGGTDRVVPVVLRPTAWGPYGPSEAWSVGWYRVTCDTPESIGPVE